MHIVNYNSSPMIQGYRQVLGHLGHHVVPKMSHENHMTSTNGFIVKIAHDMKQPHRNNWRHNCAYRRARQSSSTIIARITTFSINTI